MNNGTESKGIPKKVIQKTGFTARHPEGCYEINISEAQARHLQGQGWEIQGPKNLQEKAKWVETSVQDVDAENLSEHK